MKCMNDETIQKYIDSETNINETAAIEKHIANCSSCVQKIEEQRIFVSNLKSNLGNWRNIPVSIPEFEARGFSKRRFTINKKYIKYAAVAVACIVFLTVFLFPKDVKVNEYQLIYCFDNDFDSNRPYSQQEIRIKIMDENGRVLDVNKL